MDTRFSGLPARPGQRLGRLVRRQAQRVALLVVAGVASALAQAVNLMDVQFNSLPGGRFEVRLDFDGTPPQPQGYTIERPARIALDMPGVSSRLQERRMNLGYENATSAVILEAQDRTRMVVNLVQLAPYSTRIEGNSLFLEVGDAGARDYLKPTRGDDAISAALREPVSPERAGITDLDFRRGPDGEGQLVVTLADPRTEISAVVEGERIRIQFRGAQLPESLQRRFDVTDFATPVRSIDAQSDSRGSLISVRALGEYDYLAYQTDNEYVVSVKPLTAEELEDRRKEFAYTGERLSLNFQDIEVRAVLQLIADFTSLNLVASDTVTGRITLRLQNVPWDQALELVLRTKGLDKRQVGNVLMVAPAAEIARREEEELKTRANLQDLAPLQTEHIRIRYAKSGDVRRLLTEGSDDVGLISRRGRVLDDPRTNSLMITETAARLEDIRRVVRLLDVPIRQVLIEARIVIANSSFDHQLGIRWGAAGDFSVNSGRRLAVGADRGSVGGSLAGGGFADSLMVDLGTTATPTGSFAIGYAGSDVLIDLELSALEAQGRGEVVSQPKVITGDKMPASIKSGTQIPYQQAAASGATTVNFKDAVLQLDVTPSITPDDRVILDLVINQDSVGDLVPTGQGGFVPTIDTTELRTQVLVGNGETVVLGGVFQTEDVRSNSKVPFFGDIPYVGRLFRSEQIRQVKTETLIFITPRILADALID